MDYVKNENVDSIAQVRYFKRDKERDFSILPLFQGSGIRVNELTNLRIKDIDSSAKEISVIRKGGKKTPISITPSSLEDLNNYLNVRKEKYKAGDGENEFLFVKHFRGIPEPLTNRAVEDIVYKYTKSFDKIRHTYATKLAEQTGGDIPFNNERPYSIGHISFIYKYL